MEDLPIKLLIVSVILSSTLPYLADAYTSYSERSTYALLDSEITTFLSDVQTVSRLGVGSSRLVIVKIESVGTKYVKWVRIGGDFGNEKRYLPVIRVKVSGESVRYISLEPNVYMTTPDNHPLTLHEGEYRVKLTHGVVKDEGRDVHVVFLTKLS